MKTTCAVLLMLLGMLSACQQQRDSSAIASYDGGSILANDLQPYLNGVPSKSASAALKEKAALDVFQAKLLVTPQAIALLKTDFAFQKSLNEQIDQKLMHRYMEQLDLDIRVTEEEVQAWLDNNTDQREKRLVYNIFLPFSSAASESKDATRQQANKLRQAVAAGESFELLAKKHSVSDTAAAGGRIGYMSREMLTPRLADLIFTLPLMQVSEVFEDEKGCHLFIVRNIQGGSQDALTRFTQARRQLLEQTRQDRLLQQVAHLLKKQQLTIPDWPAGGMYQPGLLFSLGAKSLTLEDLRNRPGFKQNPRKLFLRLVQQIVFSYQYQLENPQSASTIGLETERDMAFHWLRRQALREFVANHYEDELRTFFSNNQSKFSREGQLTLAVHRWPVSAGTKPDKQQIQMAMNALRKGTPVPEAGHQVEVLEQITRAELDQQRPALVDHLPVNLQQDQIIGPLFNQSQWTAIKVVSMSPKTPMQFDNIRPRVIREFLLQRKQTVADAWLADQKEQHEFQFFGDR